MIKKILFVAVFVSTSALASEPCFAQKRNGLPPTQMDSFVRQAAGNAENIYGDESHEGPPPFMYFEYENRINSGIYDIRDKGLTTGHGSYMPSAWGRDEFLGAEWSQSGANGGNPNLGGIGTTQDQNGNPQNGRMTPADLPYKISKGWLQVKDANGNVLGYMAPGESYEDFFSGQSGHLLAGFQDKTPALLQQVRQTGRGNFTTSQATAQAIAQNNSAIAHARAQATAAAQAAPAEGQSIAQANASGQAATQQTSTMPMDTAPGGATP
ncbi:MAG: hypothetical protein EKK48_08425 [Candidatus Melainabacteria bacterium]|nr:MAG: hypothetical protein EKK48_08425 [Candidatus Melainabacteria bacterium]